MVLCRMNCFVELSLWDVYAHEALEDLLDNHLNRSWSVQRKLHQCFQLGRLHYFERNLSSIYVRLGET